MCCNNKCVILNIVFVALTLTGVIILLATYIGPLSEGQNLYQGQCYVTNSSIQTTTQYLGNKCTPTKYWQALFEVTVYPSNIEHLAGVVRINNIGWVTHESDALNDQQTIFLYNNYSCAYNTKALSMTYAHALATPDPNAGPFDRTFMDYLYLGADAYDSLRSSFISGNVAGIILTIVGFGSLIVCNIIFHRREKMQTSKYKIGHNI